VKNGAKGDIDCGGVCGPCADGQKCGANVDCLSNYCKGGTCTMATCMDGVKNGDEAGVDCGGSKCARGCVAVFTEHSYQKSPGQAVGTIPGMPGRRIRILKLGICGDADQTSGQQSFRAQDGQGKTFTWGAGQNDCASVTYRLDPTPNTGGSGRGFTYKDVNELGAMGAGFEVIYHMQCDGDGLYCAAMDEDGVMYMDQGTSARAWIKYQYE